MVSKRKKKYTTGEGNHFYSRKQALKKLQVSLTQFRRLCILKGIYPREPINRKRAQKASSGIKILYHKKDIRFLMHDPIMWKIRDYKIFHKKYARAKALQDFETMKRYLRNYPEMKIDHIIKERYPTFIDALRDLDDCLTLCFLFSTFPSLEYLPREHFVLCRRLTVEFLHAVMEAKALRKVFISIKGYYYQAELKGQTITWIVPHHFQFQPQSKADVDFKLMSTFVEFYTVMLGFVNFRLYHSLNLHYPPKFSGLTGPSDYEKCLIDEESYVSERIASLNFPVSRTGCSEQEEEIDIDTFDTDDDPLKMEEKRIEVEKIKKLKTLFKGLKFYLNREVPREPLVFIIRCFGGEVSWDSTVFLGATFDSSDETITHQIVDRPGMDKQYISRYYVQPQWLFDCVNSRELLPEQKYFLGVDLPPHLSPFTDPNRDQHYVPPEEEALRNQLLLENKDKDEESNSDEADEENEDKSDDEDNEADENEEKESEESSDDDDDDDDNENDDDDDSNEEEKEIKKAKKAKMAVTPGQVHKEVPWLEQMQEKQAFRLREKMVQKKYKKLYRSMKIGKEKRAQEMRLLKKKRRILDEKATEERKTKKRTEKSS